ncbi:MAG: 4a-hydroxytetrahydrobiopterin dehydratase [Rhodobiaceae bacterium]|jgi:4a-hydroxytetrahydrobiopterin dehydratase|nr:4a-hydroxytetrahydrobiopterin dehydratase [Rhodobiaceae bacterium]MDG2495792.1 4a-hydroxytetrahydrobiopterin dehydratase [Alphaproteobacteria bacterium]
MVEKLSNADKKAALGKLSGWKKTKGREAISKRFIFADFNAAFAWMSRVAMMAEKLDHHPEWDNVYKTVNVVLTTHDAGGLSALDISMAKFMDKTAGAAGRRK